MIAEVDAVTLTNISTNNGAIMVMAAGTVTAGLLDSSNVDDDTNDISITTIGAGADIDVATVTAGSLNDVFLDAQAGVINDFMLGGVTADLLTADAVGNMNLTTTVASIDASTGAAGNILILESDGVTLTDIDSF